MSCSKEKGTKINKPTKPEERSSDCPFHRDGHFPQDTPCWYYDINEATPEAGNRLFLTGDITGTYYHWGPFQLCGVREVIRVTPNLHLANRRVGTAGQRAPRCDLEDRPQHPELSAAALSLQGTHTEAAF